MCLNRPKDDEMCKPGYHIVHGHPRICKSGVKTWVQTHIAQNPARREFMQKENLLYVFWDANKKYPKLNAIKSFEGKGEDTDQIIPFWLEYWKNQGMSFPEVDPLLIKALIAIESRFEPKISAKVKSGARKSTAFGLMQITDSTREVLTGKKNSKGFREVKSNLIRVSRDDISDCVVNIGVGLRWLFYKYNKLPASAEKNIFNTVKYYHSWDKDGDDYARKVIGLYEKSR
jgi:hypothetical protein